MTWLARLLPWRRKPEPAMAAPEIELSLPCQADLWCRKRTSLSTMLDPTLFERYTTGDHRIDEDWIVQTNPPSAFRAEFKEGCDALLMLLREDPGLHATKGRLVFKPHVERLSPEQEAGYSAAMAKVVQTAERELIRRS
jgi:hypothetical protein